MIPESNLGNIKMHTRLSGSDVARILNWGCRGAPRKIT